MNSPVKLGDVQIEEAKQDKESGDNEAPKEEMKEVNLDFNPKTEADTKTVSNLSEAAKVNPFDN